MKTFMIVLTLLVFAQLTAAEPVDVNNVDAVAERLLDVQNIVAPAEYPLYLEVDAEAYTDAIYSGFVTSYMAIGYEGRQPSFRRLRDAEYPSDRIRFLRRMREPTG